MYLSILRLNPRSRRAMTEVSRPYELHRSLMAAFPDKATGGAGRVLFRLDIDHETGGMSVLVQSEKEPDWDKINGATGFITEYKSKQYDPVFVLGQVLSFRLRANPTKRLGKSAGDDQGKRVGIYDEKQLLEWLQRKVETGGFHIVRAMVSQDEKIEDKPKHESTRPALELLSVQFDGILKVENVELACLTISQGIGSGKGFGFGLLSIAPYRG